jgi:rhodanese-related sulfurtransferase
VTVPVAPGVEVNARPEAHLLIDVRTPGEFREGHIPGSVNMPLGDMGRFAPALKTRAAGRKVVLVCRTARGATAAFEQLSREELTDYQVLDGGMMAWAEAGLPVTYGRNAISIERQVRIIAGTLVTLGTGLGALVHPAFLLLSGAVGAGLVVAGITDTCAMGMLLGLLPWNRASQATTGEGVEGSSSPWERHV